MGRSWFFVICFCLLGGLANAQNLNGGIAIGLNGSQVDGDADLGFRKAGLSIGGYVQYSLGESLNLRPEIRFEQLGSRSKFDLIVGTGQVLSSLQQKREQPCIVSENQHKQHAQSIAAILHPPRVLKGTANPSHSESNSTHTLKDPRFHSQCSKS